MAAVTSARSKVNQKFKKTSARSTVAQLLGPHVRHRRPDEGRRGGTSLLTTLFSRLPSAIAAYGSFVTSCKVVQVSDKVIQHWKNGKVVPVYYRPIV